MNIPKSVSGLQTSDLKAKLADRRVIGGVVGVVLASTVLKRSLLARLAVIGGTAGVVAAKRRQAKPQWHDVPPSNRA